MLTALALAASLLAGSPAAVPAAQALPERSSDFRVGPRIFRDPDANASNGTTFGYARARSKPGYVVVTDLDIGSAERESKWARSTFTSIALTRGVRKETKVSESLVGRLEAGLGAFYASGWDSDHGGAAGYVSSAIVFLPTEAKRVGVVAETRITSQSGNHEFGGQSTTLGLTRRF